MSEICHSKINNKHSVTVNATVCPTTVFVMPDTGKQNIAASTQAEHTHILSAKYDFLRGFSAKLKNAITISIANRNSIDIPDK